jgi:hypothetical protein
MHLTDRYQKFVSHSDRTPRDIQPSIQSTFCCGIIRTIRRTPRLRVDNGILWLKRCDAYTRPAMLIEVTGAQGNHVALRDREPRKAYLSLGYSQRSFTHANGTALGGAVSQARVVIVYFNLGISLRDIHPMEPAGGLNTRSPGRCPASYVRMGPTTSLPPFGPSPPDPRSGTFRALCSMPSVGSLDSHATRCPQVAPRRAGQGLGVPPEWMTLDRRFLPDANHLVGTPCWESLGAAIEPVLTNRPTRRKRRSRSQMRSQTLAPKDALSQNSSVDEVLHHWRHHPRLPRFTDVFSELAAPPVRFLKSCDAEDQRLPRLLLSHMHILQAGDGVCSAL